MIPPLAIIQVRVHSTRLPRKMLLLVEGKPIIWWAHTLASRMMFTDVVIACPLNDVEEIQGAVPYAVVFGWDGPEEDVLGRFHACAHRNRTDPEAVIYRITPDDWPIDPFRESCTLAQLDRWNEETTSPFFREHIGLLFEGRRELNTQADYEAICRIGPMGR